MREIERRLKKIEEVTTGQEGEKVGGIISYIWGEACKRRIERRIDRPVPVFENKTKKFRRDFINLPLAGQVADCKRCQIPDCSKRKCPFVIGMNTEFVSEVKEGGA